MNHILLDGHVHLHSSYSLPVFLSAAHRNLARAARALSLEGEICFVLLLGDDEEYPAFRFLLRTAESAQRIDGWRLHAGEDGDLLVAERAGERLFVLPGRQIRTRQNLELLALCTRGDYPDGLDLDDSIAAVAETGAVGVLPWGFGKWLGRRGRKIREVIEAPARPHLFLGDSSARPGWLPEPRPFALARSAGMRILAGTDPLPFRTQQQRVGSYGSYLAGPFDESRVAASLKTLLLERTPSTFGHGESMLPFLANQFAMQLKKLPNSKRNKNA